MKLQRSDEIVLGILVVALCVAGAAFIGFFVYKMAMLYIAAWHVSPALLIGPAALPVLFLIISLFDP